MNSVHLFGKVVNDPKLRKTHAAGASVVNLQLLTREVWRDAGGKHQERVECHRLVLWGGAAEAAARDIQKGDAIGVEGRMQSNSYVDKSGAIRKSIDVVVLKLHLPMTDLWYQFFEPDDLDDVSTSTLVQIK